MNIESKLEFICKQTWHSEINSIFGQNDKSIEKKQKKNQKNQKIDNKLTNSIINGEDLLSNIQAEENDEDLESMNDIYIYLQNQTARNLRKKGSINYQFDANYYQPHSFVKYKILKSSPLRIQMTTEVQLILTIHSHLSKSEIIGLVGGKFENDENKLVLYKGIPCKSIPVKDDQHNVEMDPLSNLLALEELNQQNLVNVGWYHSHPFFKNTPSYIDQESHEQLSNLYSDKLYLGLIISPFNVSTKEQLCDIFMFFNKNKDVIKLNYETIGTNEFNIKDIESLATLYRENMPQLQLDQKCGKKKYSFGEKLISSVDSIFELNKELGYSVQNEQAIKKLIQDKFLQD